MRKIGSTAVLFALALATQVPSLAQTSAPPQKPVALAGNWNMSLIGDHVVPIGLVIKQDGAALTGTVSMMGSEIPVTGDVTGRAFTLTGKAKVKMHGQTDAKETELKLTGTAGDDGTLAGDFAVPNGTMKWTAERLRERPAPVSLTGPWTMKAAMGAQQMTASLVFAHTGTKVTGQLVSDHAGTLALTGSFENGELTFFTLAQDGTRFDYKAKLKVDGTLAGDLTGPSGGTPWSAERVRK